MNTPMAIRAKQGKIIQTIYCDAISKRLLVMDLKDAMSFFR